MGSTSQRGVALISALLVVSIVAVMATSMVSRKNLEIRRQATVSYWGQAYQYALGVEAWGVKTLKEDLLQGKTQDNYAEDWALVLPPMEVEGGVVGGRVEDLQGRFNLNSLPFRLGDDKLKRDNKSSANFRFEQFQGLLEDAGIEREVAYAVLDWVDSDPSGEARGGMGAEDEHYLGIDPPYRASNNLFTSVSELLLVRGIEMDGYSKLRKHVAALPEEANRINVNTAPASVLKVLDSAINESDVQQMHERQQEGGFGTIPDFLEQIIASDISGTDLVNFKKTISLTSNYFMIQANITIGHIDLQLSSLVQRSGNEVRVVRRSFGAL